MNLLVHLLKINRKCCLPPKTTARHTDLTHRHGEGDQNTEITNAQIFTKATAIPLLMDASICFDNTDCCCIIQPTLTR